MTTLATRMRELGDLEGFDVQVMEGDHPIDPRTNGYAQYRSDRKMKGTATVQDWRTKRFHVIYPGCSCQVLYGNGTEANGNATLLTVRQSYEDAE